MTQILVGDPECTFQEIMTMFDDPSLTTLKMTWWASLATCLTIPPNYIQKWKKELLEDNITHIDVVILELLKCWRMEKCNGATLGALYEAIPDNMMQLKDFVQSKIRNKAKLWNDLDSDSQNVVMQTTVQFLGRKYCLAEIREMMSNDQFIEIIRKPEMKDLFAKSFEKEEWDFGHYDIPKPLPYYIHRKLTIKTMLNPAIFKHQCSDIFVLEGIQHHHLSILARPELMDVSSDQITNLTRRFILLEHPDDYDQITKVSNHPVHRIKHENNHFYWLSTSGSCQIIRIFLLNELEEIQETTLVKQNLSAFNNRPLAICSSPGMGKTVLLAHLAYEMINFYPNRIILYLEFRSLIPKLSFTENKTDVEIVRQLLIPNQSISLIGKEILHVLLRNKCLTFELFLDGFDEVSMENLPLAKSLLNSLLECPNIRVYITSRSHMQAEIENTLEVISMNIAPFDLNHQSKFLCNFWQLSQKIKNHEKLSQFALNVLDSLQLMDKNRNSEAEYAGNPLHCFMLAQIYANHAKMYSNRDQLNFKIINSVYEFYVEFLNFKFQNIENADKKLIKIYHYKEALSSLLPSNPETTDLVEGLERDYAIEKIPSEKIFAVGILELKPDKPVFVHRTFAEFLLAEFIADELIWNQKVDMNISAKFIFDSILFIHETTREHTLSMVELKPLCNLIESSESWLTGKLNPNKLKNVLLSQCAIPFEDIQDDLFQILYHWLLQMGSNASINILDGAFQFLKCSELVDQLHKNVFHSIRVFQHKMICTFLDGALGKTENSFTLTKFSDPDFKSFLLTQDSIKLKWQLFLCTQHGYQFLTRFLVEIYKNVSILCKILKPEKRLCEDLLLSVSCCDNVEFLLYICDTVKSVLNFNFHDFFKTFSLKNKIYERTLLFQAIRRGNYKLVEYLINFIGEDIQGISDLWIACFINSWRDPVNLTKNKLKMLRLLKSSNQNFQISTLQKFFSNGVNLFMLTTLYDLCDYMPTEKDVTFMAMSIAFPCKDETEIDHLVNWLFSKNLAHLLTYEYRPHSSLLNQALVKNLLKPETLKLIHRECPFNVGMSFVHAILCKRNEILVRTIVDLSGDVNAVDDGKNTLLHWAAHFRKVEVINYLLSVGADVDARNVHENTPLHRPFLNVKYTESFHLIHDIVSLLLINKADTEARNGAGLSAFDLAEAHQDQMSIEEKTILLLEKSFQNSSSMDELAIINPQACYNTYSSQCFFAWTWKIVQISGNLNLSDYQNTTLLHNAAIIGDVKTMDYLLSNGADANIKDVDGDTPLHYIFDWYWRDQSTGYKSINLNTRWIHGCVVLLLKHFADVSVKNNTGRTPLDSAQEQKDNLKIEERTMTLLIKRFQDENEID